MKTIKIASMFLSKPEANRAAIEQRKALRVQGRHKTHKVEVLFAYDFWRTNNWFNKKKFGLKNPTDLDYIVIITEAKQPAAISNQPEIKPLKPGLSQSQAATPASALLVPKAAKSLTRKLPRITNMKKAIQPREVLSKFAYTTSHKSGYNNIKYNHIHNQLYTNDIKQKEKYPNSLT